MCDPERSPAQHRVRGGLSQALTPLRVGDVALQLHEPEDHARLAKFIQARLRRPWVVSYDNHPTIAKLYQNRRQFRYSIQYSAISSYEGCEAFIFSDGLEDPVKLDSALREPRAGSRGAFRVVAADGRGRRPGDQGAGQSLDIYLATGTSPRRSTELDDSR